MANLTIEQQTINAHEDDFVKALETICKTRVEDCRELRHQIKVHIEAKSLPFVLGCGGSHIWIHRADQHVEGKPIDSERFAIITD